MNCERCGKAMKPLFTSFFCECSDMEPEDNRKSYYTVVYPENWGVWGVGSTIPRKVNGRSLFFTDCFQTAKEELTCHRVKKLKNLVEVEPVGTITCPAVTKFTYQADDLKVIRIIEDE